MKGLYVLCVCLMLCFSTANAEYSSWLCDACNFSNNGNFCGNCGSARPAWQCAECDNDNTTKYCTNCGVKRGYSDGIHAMNQGKYDEAIEILEKSKHGDYMKRIYEAYAQKGRECYEAGNYHDALECFELAEDASFEARSQYGETVFYESQSMQAYYDSMKDIRSIVGMYMPLSYYSLAVQADKENDKEAAFDFFEKAYFFWSFDSGDDILSYDERMSLYYTYAEWLASVGQYDGAADWYTRCGDYSDSKMRCVKMQENLALQKEYREKFSFVSECCIIHRQSKGIVYKFSDTQVHIEDYSDDCYINIGLSAENITSSAQSLKLSVILNGERYNWKDRSIEPGTTSVSLITSKGLAVGNHHVVWYIGNVIVDSKVFKVVEGNSAFFEMVKGNMTATALLGVYNVKNDKCITFGKSTVKRSSLEENQEYRPLLVLCNSENSMEGINVVAVENGVEIWHWEEGSLTKGKTRNFWIKKKEPIKRTNEYVWYVNGIEVTRNTCTIED